MKSEMKGKKHDSGMKKKMDKKMQSKDMKSEAKKMGCDMKGCQMKKLDINRIVEKLKEGTKQAKPKEPFNPAIKSEIRIRDMRQEAMDQGSHGAKEYFGE